MALTDLEPTLTNGWPPQKTDHVIKESQLKVALGLANPESLVKDSRVEKTFYSLQTTFSFPQSIKFATWIQEPSEQEPRRLAIFMVTSEHPKNPKQTVVTFNAIEYEVWEEIEKDYRHYAAMSDPIRPIFAGTVRRHLQHRKNLEETM